MEIKKAFVRDNVYDKFPKLKANTILNLIGALCAYIFKVLYPFLKIVFVWLVGLRFYTPVNSYGRVEMICSPINHTFFLSKLD